MRLLNVGGEPRRILIVQGDKAILDVDAGTHLLRGADQHLQLAAPHVFEDRFFLASVLASSNHAISSRGFRRPSAAW